MTLRDGFNIGEWRVLPLEGRMIGPDGINRLQPKTMDVLLVLAERDGAVVTREELLSAVWEGRAMSDEPLTRCIGDLRRKLGDSREEPTYIETIHKRGYRLLPPVSGLEPESVDETDDAAAQKRQLITFGGFTLLLASILAVGYLLLPWSDRGVTGVDNTSPTALTHLKSERPAIAVLPFLNLSPDPADDSLADGTAETLTRVLSRMGDLKVVARSSAFVFREAEDVRVIGDSLQVDAVLEGSVQKHDNVIRITTQLVATDDGRHLWAAAFDRPMANLFAVQDEIAAEVAAALQLTLFHDSDASRGGTEDFEAYREYLLGREQTQMRTVESIAAAERHFSRAIELDPEYALAYVGYADAVILQHYYSTRPIQEIDVVARPAIETALDLNPDLGEAYASLGFLLFNLDEFDQSEDALQRAITLSPNYARGYFGYGTLFNDTGRPAEALTMHLRALDLNPLAPHINSAVAAAYEKLGRFDEAISQYERTVEIAPYFGAVYYRLGRLKWEIEGDAAATKQLYEQAMAVDPGNPWGPNWMARLFLDLGDDTRAAEWLAIAELSGEDIATEELRALLLTREGGQSPQRVEIAQRYYSESRFQGFRDRFLRIVRDAHLEQNRPDAAIALYRETHPELFQDEPSIDWLNFTLAVDLAHVLAQTGQQKGVETLLRRTEDYIAGIPRLGCCDYGLTDVEIAAIRGDEEQALTALEQAIDEGWKVDWWWDTEYNPNLQVLTSNERYHGLLRALAEALAVQHAAIESAQVR